MFRLFFLTAILLGSLNPSEAQSITLNPGSALRFTFGANPSAWGSTAPDVIQLNVYGPMVVSSTPATLSASLYNGSTLLGVASANPMVSTDTPGVVTFYWKSSSSLWPNSPPQTAVVDFTDILNGSIQARIDLGISGGSVSISPPIGDPRSGSASGSNCCISLMYRSADGAWAVVPGITNVAQSVVGSVQPPPPPIQQIAQIADGAGWKTSFAFANLDSGPVSFMLRFWGQDGQTLPIPVGNGSSGSVSGAIAPGESWFVETSGVSPTLLQGWGELSSTGRLGVTAIFTQSIPGKQDSEGTVSATVKSSRIVLSYDNTQGAVTGIAVANSNPNAPITVSMLFQPEGGAAVHGSMTIPKHGQLAVVLPSMFPVVSNTRGTVELSAPTSDLAAVGLRFGPNGSFTSLPSFEE